MTEMPDEKRAITLNDAAFVLAKATRAGLDSLMDNDDQDARMTMLAAFLFHLCQVAPERAKHMRCVLDAVRDHVAPLPPP